MVTDEAFVPHTPDPELWGTAIVYAVRLDYFGKMSKKDQQRLIDANTHLQDRTGTVALHGIVHSHGMSQLIALTTVSQKGILQI